MLHAAIFAMVSAAWPDLCTLRLHGQMHLVLGYVSHADRDAEHDLDVGWDVLEGDVAVTELLCQFGDSHFTGTVVSHW